ncbi:hypothetical protein [Fusobacterium ulcerans]|uniref:hypothetical protein n=1 Tax=Fusobacterium ulcerans TaxID=861 RepID=UPI002672E631|nr:hypothetical protein [Fusobacterium ulcerans]
MEVRMWFLYGFNGFRSHAKSKDLVDLIVYSYDESDKTLDQFYQNDSNWRLILSNNHAWIWKTDKQELMEVSIEKLIFRPQKRSLKYKSFSSIEKEYLKDPYTLDEIIECLQFTDFKTKKKTKEILAISGDINFYITLWIQNY